MRIKRVALLTKVSELRRISRDTSRDHSRIRSYLKKRDQITLDIQLGQEEHEASLEEVRRVLKKNDVTVVYRTKLPRRPLTGFDLIIPVGGDGTLLSTSHAVLDDTPILGVNSAPSFSVGYLTGSTGKEFAARFDQLRSNKRRPISVQRLQIQLGQKRLPEPVLNDVLFCADNPAVMSQYRLSWPDGSELQRSSGVWVSTPAGSTSALASAGGPTLPIAARQFAFLVREPYTPPGSAVTLRSAVMEKAQTIAIENRGIEASIFLDGSHRRYSVKYGEQVRIGLHEKPLFIFR